MNNTIELKNISFSYGEEKVFSSLNLKFYQGERVLILGESGRGKSTLLNLIAGITEPREGEVLIFGERISGLKSKERDRWRSNNVGYIFQQFNLIPYLTAKENILFPLIHSKARFSRVQNENKELQILSNSFGISNQLDKFPNELSIGQQQRVAGARAIIGNPQIILADEPTSALDEKNTDAFISLLMKEQKKHLSTLIFVSHNKSLTKYFDRIIEL